MESGIYITANETDFKDIQVKFGGKIGVGFAADKNSPKAIVVLQELDHSYTPGVDVIDKEYNPDDFNIKLIFDSEDSINVLERALNDARLHILLKKAEE